MVKKYSFVILILMVACIVAQNVQAMQASVDSNAAFARLKTLVGKWQASTSMGNVQVEYELIAGGKTLLTREVVENLPPMATAYHLDADRLLLTHYCMAGNQPRMQAKMFNPRSGELRFEFLDATNVTESTPGHMRNARFRFVDENHFVAEWDFYEGSLKKNTEIFNFTRVR